MCRQLLYIFAVVVFVVSCSHNKTEKQQETIDTVSTMVIQIQKCSKLYTTEIRVHKIITHNDTKKLKGSLLGNDFDIDLPMSKRKIAIPMYATLKAYIDFGNFSKDNIRRQGEKIEIILPDPKFELTSSKIDHKEIKRYVALARSNFSDEELTSYERQGRESIIRSIPQMNVLEQARANAAKVIIPMIRQMGYKEENITVSFRKKFTLGDLSTLFDRSVERRTTNE